MGTVMGIMMVLMVAGVSIFGMHKKMAGVQAGEELQIEGAAGGGGGVKGTPEVLMEADEAEKGKSIGQSVKGDLSE